jgi:K+-sensing histidine kinase KdpD
MGNLSARFYMVLSILIAIVTMGTKFVGYWSRATGMARPSSMAISGACASAQSGWKHTPAKGSKEGKTNEDRTTIQRYLRLRWPHWRHSLLRTLVGLLLLGLAFLGVLAAQRLGLDPSMSSAPLLLVIVLVALFWGTKPALLTLLVSLVLLDYLALPPLGTFHLPTWKGLVQLLPFLLTGGIIAVLTAQREYARHHAQKAEQDAEQYTDEVEQDTILRETSLLIVANALIKRIEALRAYAARCPGQLIMSGASAPHAERKDSSSETLNAQIDAFQELLADLPSLKTIHSAMTFFHLPPYDLQEICQVVVEDLQRTTGRVIACESSSSPLLIERDGERVCLILISLLKHVLNTVAAPSVVAVHLSQHEADVIIEARQVREALDEHQDGGSLSSQQASKNRADLWWIICQEQVKEQGGQLIFNEPEQVWRIVLARMSAHRC